MNCEFDRELLSLHVDGALKPELLRQVESHISGCRDCREEIETMRILGEALHSLPRERAPAALTGRIIAEAEGNVRRTTWDTARRAGTGVWMVAMNGFRIEDDREELLRRQLPEWVARWVLFI